MGAVACKIYRRWLRRVSARLPVVDVVSPAQRWPVTWPLLCDRRLKMTADELDQLHHLWPEFWPPSKLVMATKGGVMIDNAKMAQAFDIAERMVGARDAMRGILGDRYEERVKPYRELLRQRTEEGQSVVGAVTDCVLSLRAVGKDTGPTVAMLLAAACEELD